MPKISIIVPIYNVETYLDECLGALVNQTLQDIEIICVDDCGTDNSMQIAERFAANDARIKLVYNDKNSGLSASRNNGMKLATAPYIMFCDSDDWFADDMCQVMYDKMESTGAELGIFGFEVFYEANLDKKSADDQYFAVKYNGIMPATHDVLDKHPVCACGKIYRRDLIQEHDLQFPYGLRHEDEFWYPAYCVWVNNVVFVQNKFYKYRRRAGSIMNKTYRKKSLNLDPLHIAMEYFNYVKEHNQLEKHKNWFWGIMFFRLLGASLNYSGKHNTNQCYKMAHKFIQENWDKTNADFVSKRRIAQIMNKNVHTRKILFGIIKIKEDVTQKRIQFAGITVWSKKYVPNVTD